MVQTHCESCTEDDCYNCDYALESVEVSKLDELLMKRRFAEAAVRRYQETIERIDREIEQLQK